MYLIDNQQNIRTDPALSLALDEVLFRSAEVPVLRLYRWKSDCGSLGFHRKYEDIRNFEKPERSLPWFRRLTGGGAALHRAGEPGITLVFPKGGRFAAMTPGRLYHEVHEALLRALRTGGIAAELVGREDSKGSGVSCLASPVEHDLLERGEKIAGGALRRSNEGILYQGMLKVDVPVEFGGRLAGELGFDPVDLPWPDAGVEAEADRLRAERYSNTEWTRRR